MSIHVGRDSAFMNLFDGLDQSIGLMRVRLTTINEVAAAQQEAWQRIYDAEIGKATRDGGEITEEVKAAAREAADLRVPAMTEEESEAIIEGESDGSEIVETATEAGVDAVFADYIASMGGRLVSGMQALEAELGEDETPIADPTNAPGEIPRYVIVPADTSDENIAQIQQSFIEDWEARNVTEEEDPFYQEERVPTLNETDPYIRTPAAYRVGGDAARDFTSRFGGTLMDSGEELFYPTNDAMDQTEIDFINRAQGSDRPDEYARTRGDQQYPSTRYSGQRSSPLDGIAGPLGPTYRESDVLDMISSMGTRKILEFQQLAADAGWYGDSARPDLPGQMSADDQQILGLVMGQANVSGETVWPTLEAFAQAGREASSRMGPSYTKEPFSVPAHLRATPGVKTIAEEAKGRFAQKLGRNATEEELVGLGNELSGYYEKSNQEEIALYLAAYNGDNQGLLTGAQMQRIEEPGAATSFDIADKWANEIDLNKRRETNSESFSRLLSATMGNRPSVGNLTAAGGVARIGRQ